MLKQQEKATEKRPRLLLRGQGYQSVPHSTNVPGMRLFSLLKFERLISGWQIISLQVI